MCLISVMFSLTHHPLLWSDPHYFLSTSNSKSLSVSSLLPFQSILHATKESSYL